jgi:hypothetical protein
LFGVAESFGDSEFGPVSPDELETSVDVKVGSWLRILIVLEFDEGNIVDKEHDKVTNAITGSIITISRCRRDFTFFSCFEML